MNKENIAKTVGFINVFRLKAVRLNENLSDYSLIGYSLNAFLASPLQFAALENLGRDIPKQQGIHRNIAEHLKGVQQFKERLPV